MNGGEVVCENWDMELTFFLVAVGIVISFAGGASYSIQTDLRNRKAKQTTQ